MHGGMSRSVTRMFVLCRVMQRLIVGMRMRYLQLLRQMEQQRIGVMVFVMIVRRHSHFLLVSLSP